MYLFTRRLKRLIVTDGETVLYPLKIQKILPLRTGFYIVCIVINIIMPIAFP